MNILLTAKLADTKLQGKLTPILDIPDLECLFLVRKTPLNQPGITNINPPSFFTLPLLFELWRLVVMIILAKRNSNLTVVGIQGFPHGLIATVVAKLCGKGSVLWLIGSDVRIRLHQPIWGWAIRWMIKAADFIFVMGEPMRDEVLSVSRRPDCVEVMQLDVSQPILGSPISARSIDLLFVGNLITLKRPDRIVSVVSFLKRCGMNAKCLILGDGAEKESLSALVSQKGVEDSVTIAGFCPNPVEMMRDAKLLLLLSESEGLPTVVVEAAYCGLPVVCTDVGDTRAMLGDSAHVVFVPVSNEAQQCREIAALLSDPVRLQFLSERGTEFARLYRKRWSRANLTTLWIKALEQSCKS